jgi:hypothetical protein
VGRAGKNIRDDAKRERSAFVRRNAVVFTTMVFAYVAISTGLVVAIHPASAERAIFAAGAASTGLAWLMWALVTQLDGQQHKFFGANAEADSSRVLGRLRRHGWRVVDDVAFDRFNIDHVVVGPGGIFAVETKWTSRRWQVADGRLSTGGPADPVRQAANGATTIARLLKHHANVVEQVHPVVVIWGPGRPRVARGGTLLRDDVTILDGRHCRTFFRELEPRLREDVVLHAAEALYAFVDQRDKYNRRLSGERGAPTRGTRGRATGGC